jgi:hypothetical protein
LLYPAELRAQIVILIVFSTVESHAWNEVENNENRQPLEGRNIGPVLCAILEGQQAEVDQFEDRCFHRGEDPNR